ncbi:rCG45792 [Rattus norvegicus]|uniref:RCG45792 n=1 Tax=Rattus norvegicus TaxID=10116 RepID=A6JTF5_RAT|nr:rCG45792 [Rattus norvegicus]
MQFARLKQIPLSASGRVPPPPPPTFA